MRLKTRLMLKFDILLKFLREISKRITANSVSPIGYLHKLAAKESAEFMNDEVHQAKIFSNRLELMKFALANIKQTGACAEFGVYKGESIDYIASILKPRQVYGFDSFEGLQESWAGSSHDKSAFDLKGILPRVPKNVTLVPGWFDQSIPKWIATQAEPLALIHIDSDTYEACKTIFELAHSRINEDTLIVFDEHHGYPGWKNGEYKALNEHLKKHGLRRTYLAFSEMAAVLKIHL